jgi:lysophospholipase L1-like esterase
LPFYPQRAVLVLLCTLGLVYAAGWFESIPVRGPEVAQWRSAFDLLEGKRIDFGITLQDPNASLDAYLAREQEALLIDPQDSLREFFQALQLAEDSAKQAVEGSAGNVRPVHVVHYGDSPTTADLITADIRRRLQERFGNAGHGFSLVAPPWVWYQHKGVKLSAEGWELQSPAIGKRGDGIFGMGGVSFDGEEGAFSEITLADGSHTRLRIYFMRRPEGGVFTVEANGEEIAETNTDGEREVSAWQTYPIPPGARNITIRVLDGTVRVFGVEFFKNRPGVVYSSLGLNGASTETLSRHMDLQHWGRQLRAASPDLVVINYGTNESVHKDYVASRLEEELRRAIRRVREAVPDAAILVMSPMDRGVKDDEGNISTAETIPQVVEIQKRVAAEMNVAFFNTFAAMGGSGTMAKWYASNPRLVGSDYIHPLPAGAKLVGDMLYDGIEQQYRMFKLRELRKTLPGRDDKGKQG